MSETRPGTESPTEAALQLRPLPRDSPASAAHIILTTFKRVKAIWLDEFPTEELLRAWALDPCPVLCADHIYGPEPSRRPSNGVSDVLIHGLIKLRAARSEGLGTARITAGHRPRVRATAAEIVIDLWRELLALAEDVGIGEAYNATLAVLFPETRRIPHGWGVDAERFAVIVAAALSGGGFGQSAAGTMARRLARDAAWQDAVAHVKYLSTDFETSLDAVLAVDLRELESQWALEQAGADFDPIPIVPNVPPVVEPDTDKTKGKKGKDINARMLRVLASKPESFGWSARQWADHLGCSASTVVETRTWRERLKTARSVSRADAAIRMDRSRTRPRGRRVVK